MKTNIVLIGFMATGKSVVGRRLAKKRDMVYVDVDQEIEKLAGMTIKKLFRQYGEARFRGEEKCMVDKVSRLDGQVISTGGGLVLNPDNLDKLRKKAYIIALDADLTTLYARLALNKDRPLAAKASQEEIKARYLERKPFYAGADFTVDTTDQSIETTVDMIDAWVNKKLAKTQGA